MRLKSKRLISLLLAGSMMVSMLPASAVTAFAETTATAVVAENSNTETSGDCGATKNDHVHWNYASGVLTISGTGAMKDYEAKGTNPDLAVDGNGVITTDNRPWAKYLNDIVELRVESGITAIGKNALAFCKNLKKLNLDGVTGTISIHGAAFGHTGIEELDIPTTVSEIGNYAFNACENLKKVTFRGQTKLLGTPFPNENALEELVIADKAVITAADKNGNSNNSRPFGANTLKSLKKLELLGEFKDVDSSATTTTKNEGLWDATFSANTELTDVTVSGSNMQYVSRAAFPAIKTLNVVGGNATAKFMCTSRGTNNNLENISIDVGTYNGVKEAFNGATALKTFVLKANTVTLGEYEFGRDNSLKAIDLSQCGNVTYGNYCFGVGANAATKAVVYVKDSSTAPSNAPCAVLVVNGGNVDLTKEGFDSVVMPGYRATWYTDANFNTPVNEDTLKNGPAVGGTYYADWHKTPTIETDDNNTTETIEKTYVGQPVEIPVTVEAEQADINRMAKATLKFTDKDGKDDKASVKEVLVNGMKLEKYENIDIASLLNQNNGVATLSLAPVEKMNATLTVTYTTPGEHNVEIILLNAIGDEICSQKTAVQITAEPTLTFDEEEVAAALEDGTALKSGDTVEHGATVTLKLANQKQEALKDSNMKFNGFVLNPRQDSLKYVDEDKTTAAFAMPATGNVEVSISDVTAAPAEDDSMDAAAVVTGVVLGTGTAILAYHIGTEVYAEQVLGKGVAIPRTREEVALKAWELAGKPAVELNGEPLSEAAQAEKWAVESGLMQNVDGSFNGSKKMSKLKALRTLDAAKKLG